MLFTKSFTFALSFASLLSANAVDPVILGTAGDYAVLTKSGISTVAPSIITGDIAVSPSAGTAITGFSLILDSDGESSLSTQVEGTAYAASYVAPTPYKLTVAVGDMETAYTDAASRPNDDPFMIDINDGEIGELTLTAGVYTFGSDVSMKNDVTISGTATDIFIIQT